MSGQSHTALVSLGAGIGNLVLATPLLIALAEMGWALDVELTADYPESADLFRPWSAVREVFLPSTGPRRGTSYSCLIPALPPFYAHRYRQRPGPGERLLDRPADAVFYQNEQTFYLSFARQLGYPQERHPLPCLPISPIPPTGVTPNTVVLAPGCKTGEMAAKRWPHFSILARELNDVAIVGTKDDLYGPNGQVHQLPAHAKCFAGRLNLRETAECLAGAGLVIANDSGLAHVAAAVGVPTLILFGPTPDQTLGPFPPNVIALRNGLECEPCWFTQRFSACQSRWSCLADLSVDRVLREIQRMGFFEDPTQSVSRTDPSTVPFSDIHDP